ncbi:hypothetical protein DL93DRAFT_2083527 [Clavulina sp. PMI_390]|nr:hypothetical protein DL93DRAFT_2083527 [Clavulina sp. PMI_390]
MPPKRKSPPSSSETVQQTVEQAKRPVKKARIAPEKDSQLSTSTKVMAASAQAEQALTPSNAPTSSTMDAPTSATPTLPDPPSSTSAAAPAPTSLPLPAKSSQPPSKKRPKITRLAPSRPFPQVPAGSSATGPYSTRGEGKNRLGITRQHELGGYLKRCKNLVEADGYRKIYLTAMGAAIAHALLLTTSLPAILAPTFAPSDIKTNITTGTVQCIDDVLPDEEDEDEDEGGMQVRQKSTINVEIVIGDGERVQGAKRGNNSRGKRKRKLQPSSSVPKPAPS